MKEFDIIILGGGHAGVEAAWIAQQFQSLSVAVITMAGVPIGSAPCNPAVGGVGKGQVVREIDAMGGLMGRLADLSGIQFRVLNESKGYAVQSTRIQIDKVIYSREAEKILSDSRIEIIRDQVQRVVRLDDSFSVNGLDTTYSCKKLVVTTGTFLNGKIHVGPEVSEGGRVECLKSAGLDDLFSSVKTLGKRFKTGTPPRLKRQSIDFSRMTEQESDPDALNFHFEHPSHDRKEKQLSCYLTRTNAKTLKLIRENKEKSPIFNGQIQAIGPRYCPSIEDKAFRYEDKDIHHVFVEPESHSLDSFYPNGISTSLPRDIQLQFIQTIEGLENAEIDLHGYAVEYDVVSTQELNQALEYIDLPGLYFAGQVCGTSGYEEAAGQGLVAGMNAALSLLDRSPVVFDRDNSYIGVMIEDLVTNERDEPYRLFTARSENRLFIREDNAILRMGGYRQSLGLFYPVDSYISEFVEQFSFVQNLCDNMTYLPSLENQALSERLRFGALREKTSLSELLQRSQVDPVELLSEVLKDSGLVVDERVIRTSAISIKYRGYIKRNEVEMAKISRLSKRSIDWSMLLGESNISFECKRRIEKIKPETFGQLQRIEGIRPATLGYVASHRL